MLKHEKNCSYIGGGEAYLLQSVAIQINHTANGDFYVLTIKFRYIIFIELRGLL